MAPALGIPTEENQPGGLPVASQPSDALAKAQEDEREVLKAIFMDDYEEIEAKGAWSVRHAFYMLPYHRRVYSENPCT